MYIWLPQEHWMFLRKNRIWEWGWEESMTGYSTREACIKSKRFNFQLQMSFKCGFLSNTILIPTTLSPFLMPRFFNAEARTVTFFLSWWNVTDWTSWPSPKHNVVKQLLKVHNKYFQMLHYYTANSWSRNNK